MKMKADFSKIGEINNFQKQRIRTHTMALFNIEDYFA